MLTYFATLSFCTWEMGITIIKYKFILVYNFSNRDSNNLFNKLQFSSVAQSCLILCDPVNHSTPGLSVHHQLPESTQTHVHWVGDAIQPSHPLSCPSPPALNRSQHNITTKKIDTDTVYVLLRFHWFHMHSFVYVSVYIFISAFITCVDLCDLQDSQERRVI